MLVFCPKCELGNPEDAECCMECGHQLKVPETPPEIATPVSASIPPTVRIEWTVPPWNPVQRSVSYHRRVLCVVCSSSLLGRRMRSELIGFRSSERDLRMEDLDRVGLRVRIVKDGSSQLPVVSCQGEDPGAAT